MSKVKTFSDCNKKYHFAYVLKMPRKDFDYHIFGHFVHKVLEVFHQKLISGASEPFHSIMGMTYKDVLSEYKSRMTEEARQEAYQIIDSYLEKIAAEKDEVKSIQSVEKKFALNLTDHIVLNGMIDRVQIDKDGIPNVCDYKTTKNKRYLTNDFLQLLTYAFVLWSEDKTIKKVRGSYILLRHNFERITKEFSVDEIMAVKDKYEAYAKQIEEEVLWRPNPTRLCNYCEFLPLCDAGTEYVNPLSKNGAKGW